MGQIANQKALELFFKLKQMIKDKKEEKKQAQHNANSSEKKQNDRNS